MSAYRKCQEALDRVIDPYPSYLLFSTPWKFVALKTGHSIMATQYSGDFARVLPFNRLARRLFASCFVYARNEDPFHLNFMVPLPDEQVFADDEPIESSTDYESHFSEDVDESLQWGCFVLSFDESRQPEFPPLGWRFGRGSTKLRNRGVDILLAKPRDIASKSLASCHFRLRISEHSGLLMLSCGAKGNVLLEANIGGKWMSLEPKQEILVYQSSTLLRVGLCELEIQYTIGETDREAFLAMRNSFIKKWLVPPSDIYKYATHIPGESLTVRGEYLQLATRGHGTFGWISQGFNTRTGQLIAIKEFCIKKKEDWITIQNEIEMGRRFQVESTIKLKRHMLTYL